MTGWLSGEPCACGIIADVASGNVPPNDGVSHGVVSCIIEG